MQLDCDAIVIGAGFAGAATSYHLSRAGKFEIILLEKESVPGRHASGKNAGLLRQALADAQAAAMVQETLRALEAPPEDWKFQNIFRRTGSLLLGENRNLSALAGIMKNMGAPFEWHDRNSFPENLGEEWRSKLKAARYENLIYSPQDGVVDTREFLQNYLEASQSRGVQLRSGEEACRIVRDGETWILETAENHYRARAILNAAGAWAETLGGLAGLPARGLIPRRRHLYVSAAAEGWTLENPYLWDVSQEFYFRPEEGGLLLSPGDEDPWAPVDPEIDPQMENLLRAKLGAYFPSLAGVELSASRACLRTAWSGGPFLVAEEPGAPGFFWVAGLGGHGMGSSFGLGRRAAEQVTAFLNSQKS